ncbi:NAD(P)-binding domain-containing protein [Dactylosporangium matsuzakiense]|uniref:Pyridine nucleotide-disulfide oxidoreductase n=1 Tax=Dactylosporangium matsuzakiense TaxID=53360 RepID=A0A9W6KGQ4_9ACTN|nr:NAD(P)-binding domain-containing protein [Dactylosporangium matsuzakiense]UWZ42506.1 NAD(P)-binding domain-containing protein [Dactylosporangium matsuzakiense]GLL00577.1 pyridine nucleotide-disulfide oxidoreductase [Dactylosporangium matsuzakiense]
MTLDYLIIGAGPAGLQLAALLERDGADYLVLEAGAAPGTFFETYPRHRTLISINKIWTGSEDPEFNLRSDWNSLLSDDPELLFKHYTRRYFPKAPDLVRYLADFAERTKAKVRYNARVTRVARAGETFTVDADGATFSARRVIVATGVSQLYVPPIPGAELAERYDTVSVDPDDFTNQRVLIIGKGNSAFETADALVETAAVIHVAGPHSVRLAWQTHYVGHLRAVNNNFLDTYQLKSQNAVLDGTVERIERRAGGGLRIDFRYARTVERLRQLEYDRIILATGFRFDAAIFDETARPALVINDRFPEQTSAFESVNVPGLYFAGTLTQQRDFKKSTNGFIHGFRYGVRALHRILGLRHHGTPWPATPLEPTPDAIADAVIARINVTSALWQQFAVLADVVLVTAASAAYLPEVPVAFLRDGGLGDVPLAFVTTLEYGPDHDTVDPFDITVPRIAENDAAAAHDASYLHPVVRVHRGGAVVAEHHLAENLENHWDLPAVHQQPLSSFIKHALADVG